MDFSQMDSWNYNCAAGNKGWIYKALEKFETTNESIMTPELLEQIQTETAPLEVYEKVTQETIKDRESLIRTTNTLLNQKTNIEEYGRSK